MHIIRETNCEGLRSKSLGEGSTSVTGRGMKRGDEIRGGGEKMGASLSATATKHATRQERRQRYFVVIATPKVPVSVLMPRKCGIQRVRTQR